MLRRARGPVRQEVVHRVQVAGVRGVARRRTPARQCGKRSGAISERVLTRIAPIRQACLPKRRDLAVIPDGHEPAGCRGGVLRPPVEGAVRLPAMVHLGLAPGSQLEA